MLGQNRLRYLEFQPVFSVNNIQKDTLEKRRRVDRLECFYGAYVDKPAWKEVSLKINDPTYIGKNDHSRKVCPYFRRKDVGK